VAANFPLFSSDNHKQLCVSNVTIILRKVDYANLHADHVKVVISQGQIDKIT